MSSSDSEKWHEYRQAGKSAWAGRNFASAEKSWSLAMDEAERLGADDPRLTRSLLDLAGLYSRQKDYDRAEPLLRRAMEIAERTAGQEDPRVAIIRNNLGALLFARRQYAEAEAEYRSALSIVVRAHGPFHQASAIALNNLAEVCRVQGRFTQAEPIYRYILAISEFVDPPAPVVAGVLTNLAYVLRARGEYEEAKSVLERILELEQQGADKDHFDNIRRMHAEMESKVHPSIWSRLRSLLAPGHQ